MKFSIGKKIFLGNLPLILVILMITYVALDRLDEAHGIFTRIVSHDIALKNHAEEMVEVLRDRESQVLRYLILQSDDMSVIMEKRSNEYQQLLTDLKPLVNDLELLKIEQFNQVYLSSLETTRGLMEKQNSREYTTADSLRTTAYVQQGELLQQLIKSAAEQQGASTKSAVSIILDTRKTVFTVAVSGLISALIISFLITAILLQSVRKLKKAAAQVSHGEFENLPSVHLSDELGELSRSFNEMANRLIELEKAYKDASPLTRLPGGLAVETVVQTRIDQSIPFAFLMFDLDNFKPFNDRYGYSRGNLVIKHTAKIIKETAENFGGDHDFVGHIGGDDFVIVTEPEKLELICSTVISSFDTEIIQFYDEEDCKNGHIVSVSRRGVTQEFPIMSISISAVNSNFSELSSYIQVGEIIAELKKYAKSFTGSNFVIDRRNEHEER